MFALCGSSIVTEDCALMQGSGSLQLPELCNAFWRAGISCSGVALLDLCVLLADMVEELVNH